tara:strand:+ start:165 stop:341 length:177 start_codon:yes stop_codon:yes gene_type:complete
MEENKEFNKGPILETTITKSKDGKYVIHKTIVTDIKPIKYYEKVLEGNDGKKNFFVNL